MRNIYGNRSIIPNNYYFTFDKIYENIAEANNGAESDGIFIGRAVLAKQESTVLIKTAGNSYLAVAKLDNSGRFQYSEGVVLTEDDNIDELYTKGMTPNEKGIFIAIKPLTGGGTYPNLTIKKPGETVELTDINSQENFEQYKEDSIFRIHQYSLNPEIVSYTSIDSVDILKTIYNTLGYVFKKEGDLYALDNPDIEELSVSFPANTYYYPTEIHLQVFQVIQNIGEKRSKETENISSTKDSQSKYTNVNNINKNFIRDCIFKYKLKNLVVANEEQGEVFDISNIYSYDATTNEILFNKKDSSDNYSDYLDFIKLKNKWSDWADLDVKYIGYLENLNSTGFNHTNKKDGDDFGYLNLVNAINQLDKVIGSTNQRFGKESLKVNTADDGYTEIPSGDTRPLKLPETNLANAIVRQGADIGIIDNISNNNNYNINFTSDTKADNSSWEKENNFKNINSLVDAVKVLDQAIGKMYNINNTNELGYINSTESTYTSENASMHTLENALLNLKGSIGLIGDLKTQNNIINSFKKAKTDESIDNSQSTPEDQATGSLVAAINILNTAIGNLYQGDNKNKKNTDTNKIKYEDLVTVINTIDNYLGKVREKEEGDKDFTATSTPKNKINYENLVYVTDTIDNYLGTVRNGEEKTSTPKNGIKYEDLVTVINAIDNYLGKVRDAEKQVVSTETNGIKYEDLVTVINVIDSYLGKVRDAEKQVVSTETNGIKYDSLVSTINVIDSYLGVINELKKTLGWEQNNNFVDSILEIRDIIGNKEEITSLTRNAESNFNNKQLDANIQYCIQILDKVIGNLKNLKLNGYDLDNKEKQNLVNHLLYLYENKVSSAELINATEAINNLAENFDIMDAKISNLENNQSESGVCGSINLEWGTF